MEDVLTRVPCEMSVEAPSRSRAVAVHKLVDVLLAVDEDRAVLGGAFRKIAAGAAVVVADLDLAVAHRNLDRARDRVALVVVVEDDTVLKNVFRAHFRKDKRRIALLSLMSHRFLLSVEKFGIMNAEFGISVPPAAVI